MQRWGHVSSPWTWVHRDRCNEESIEEILVSSPCLAKTSSSHLANSGWQGNIIMTDEWFDEYMFRLVVDKKYVPASLMKYFDQKPILLPAWDPMFLPEE